MIHHEQQFHIYFGNAVDAMYPIEYLNWHDMPSLLAQPQIKPIVNTLSLEKLFFLHQVHGTHGYTINSTHSSLKPFASDGDYLITNQPYIGIGVVTADCLPVICIDTKNKVVGIAHAGWRGALAGVVPTMVTTMQQQWQTNLNDCRIFLGPSARVCCYQVGQEFKEYLAPYPWYQEVLSQKSIGYFFDMPLFLTYQLQQTGINYRAINQTYNLCTICNNQFYSVRRQAQTGRQMTVVALKKLDC